MIIFIEIDFFLILIMILFVLAGAYSIVKNIIAIIWSISMGLFLLGALASLFTHIFFAIPEDSNSKVVSLFYISSGIVRTFFLGIGWEIIYEAFSLGMGQDRVKDYVLLGEVSIDSRLLSLIIMVVSIAITDVIHFLSYKREKELDRILMCSANIFLLLLVLIGTTYIGLKSNTKNSLSVFNYDSPEYVLTKSADMYQYVRLEDDNTYVSWWYPFGSPISTGKFKQGTEVYSCGEEFSIKKKKYVLVTDKTSVGYVEKDALKDLVYYKYYLKKGTKAYVKEPSVVDVNSEDAVFITVKKKIFVKLTGITDVVVHSTYIDNVQKYIQVELPSGKKGFVEESLVKVVRKEK